MNQKEGIKLLQDTIRNHRRVLRKIEARYGEFVSAYNLREAQTLDFYSATILAEFFDRYYTCMETIFLRISQFFENQLEPSRWHQNLLERMRIRFEGVRERVLSDETYPLVLEFLKFRHFKRYYYDVDYDFDKLLFLRKKFERLVPAIHLDLDSFDVFLTKLADSL